MALVTLSGTISAADLNNNFNDKVAALAALNDNRGHDLQYNLSVLDLTTALNVGLRTLDFVAPMDLELKCLGVSMFNPDATSRTARLTLTAIATDETVVSKYLLDETVNVPVIGNTAAEYSASRATTAYPVFLVKGMTYRLTMDRVDANGGVIDRAYGFALCRTSRRYR